MSPTDWWDTTDQNEYIGPAPLLPNKGQEPKPKTGAKNMKRQITDQQATAAFHSATGYTPELPQVKEWALQCLQDFDDQFDDLMTTEQMDMERVLADFADQEAGRNTYYMNALIAADAGIWATDSLDDYGFGSNGPLQMGEVLTIFTYEVTLSLILSFVSMIASEVME